MPTPHISAQKGDFAEACLLPGDPKRAEVIATELLQDAKLVTEVRAMLGFTGTYEGRPVSVMGTGMGIPSAGIYINELITEYGVQRLIRVGSCGALHNKIALRDLIIVNGASSDTATTRSMFGFEGFAPVPDFSLTASLVEAAKTETVTSHVGSVFTTDLFYEGGIPVEVMRTAGCMAVEMEAAGLFAIATRLQARAAAVLTVSDHLLSGEQTSSQDREVSFLNMARFALQALKADASQ